jgi:hypothetical protein
MVSAASPLAGDDGLGTPFGAPPGRRPGLPPTRRPSPPKRSCPDASGPTAVTLSKAKGLTLRQILRSAQNDAQALPARRRLLRRRE